jgi:(E)-4-hydroxy-3-methyl-but-2-enyl pyrophosphate reductase (IPP and DMAPP forming)
MDSRPHTTKLGLSISIDQGSGFCNGVVRAIEAAEQHLAQEKTLHSLGAIVHNNKELERLQAKGLQSIQAQQLSSIPGQKLLIRAHGEPPQTYALARAQQIQIIDCTCPVVLRLQKKIQQEYANMQTINGQIAIFGKKGHAEVNGLVGQVGGDALIIEQPAALGEPTQLDELDYSRPLSLFAQTTQDPQAFRQLCRDIEARYLQAGRESSRFFRAFNTICKQVSDRLPALQAFARRHDLIIFVSGRESSNGRVLFEACRSANPRSYKIASIEEIDPERFRAGDRVGICGATSTPKWLMEEVAQTLNAL